jgi:hypothetical protein
MAQVFLRIRPRRSLRSAAAAGTGVLGAAIACGAGYGWLYAVRGIRLPGPTLDVLLLQQPRARTAVSAVVCIAVWAACALLFERLVTRIELHVPWARVPLFALYALLNAAVVATSHVTVVGVSITAGLDAAAGELSPYLFGLVAATVAGREPLRRYRRSRGRGLAPAH